MKTIHSAIGLVLSSGALLLLGLATYPWSELPARFPLIGKGLSVSTIFFTAIVLAAFAFVFAIHVATALWEPEE